MRNLRRLVAFVRSKGFDPGNRTIHLADRVIQHMMRDAKRQAGKALPDESIVNMPSHLARPRAVLWEHRKDGKPTLAYVFDVPGDKRQGKFVIRVEMNAKINGEKQTYNAVVTSGLAMPSDLRDRKSYTKVTGEL